MKEDFLHYVWQYKLFDFRKLKTSKGKNIEIVKTGIYNKNSGPDFLNAQIKIDELLWVGNVEIHVKSSDWYSHNHEGNTDFDTVILHVVWQHDVEIFTQNNNTLATLILKDYVDKKLLKNYKDLLSPNLNWIPCENQIKEIESFVFNNWLERLYLNRLEKKSTIIKQLLEESNYNYEAVLFQLLAKNFGLKVNGESFLDLAKSIDFSIIRKTRFEELTLSALLFGKAGFLDDNIEDEYFLTLKKEYEYLKHKYKLNKTTYGFQFFRMRPNNFPTIRLAQLIALYNKHSNLFKDVMNFTTLTQFYNYFSVEVNDFWKVHYTFETISKKSSKKITKSFIDLLIINTIIPLKFIWQQSRGEDNNSVLLQLIKEIKPEKNAIISKFSDLKITSKNAFETQALLELKNNYCAKKLCLQCAIGNELLRK